METAKEFLARLTRSNRYNNEASVNQNCDLLIKDIRGYLESEGFDMALACLDVAIQQKGNRLRQDGTPSILHELSQVLYTISLMADGLELGDPESVIALNLIHDLGEDYDIKPEELKAYLQERSIDDEERIDILMNDFDIITRRYGDDEPKYGSKEEYFNALRESQNASIAKLIDTIHNVATQIGAKSEADCKKRIDETLSFLPDYMTYIRQRFPSQSQAYESCKTMLTVLCETGQYWLSRTRGSPPSIKVIEKNQPDKGFKVPKGTHPFFLKIARINDLLLGNIPTNKYDQSAEPQCGYS